VFLLSTPSPGTTTAVLHLMEGHNDASALQKDQIFPVVAVAAEEPTRFLNP